MAINPATLYPGKTGSPTAAYPYGLAQNITVASDGTGTPWEKVHVNDLWGFHQSLLDAAGIVPTGNPDEVGASQYLDALRLVAGYPGLIQPMAINVDPATLGLRILLLRGDVLTSANYPELVAATYVGDSDNAAADGFYKTSDAGGTTPSTSGAYFVLPDFSGRFLRAIDVSGTLDPDADRVMADSQAATVVAHRHSVARFSSSVFYGLLSTSVESGSTQADVMKKASFTPGVAPTNWQATGMETELGDAIASGMEYDNQYGNGRGLDVEVEPRPYNAAVNFGVWY